MGNPYSSYQSEVGFQIWKKEQLKAKELMYEVLPFEEWYPYWCYETGRFYITD